MCYTEADCSVAALLHSHCGQADDNFVRKGTNVASKFSVSVLQLVLWEAGLDFGFGNKIAALLCVCRIPLCRGNWGFLLNAMFLDLVAVITSLSFIVCLLEPEVVKP